LNILLTGGAGQLGSELLPLLSARGHLTVTDRSEPVNPMDNWFEMDISDGGKLEGLLNRVQPDLIVNAAAYTAVDQAEADPETAFSVNAELPSRLAKWAFDHDAHLIHYSTDYVFDGKASRPYLETDPTHPKSVYGETKLAGEQALEVAGCKYVILRTSWVYSSHGKNFVLSMLDLARKGLSLKIVNDQQGCPTSARNLALASDAVIESWQSKGNDHDGGVYHYCDDLGLSWYDFACVIFRLAVSAGLLDDEPDIAPVPSSEFPQLAERPKWSILDSSRFHKTFDFHSASLEGSLQTVIDEIRTRT
jgi:dTDP-4-dehydrorhamnose reductase